MLILTAGTSQTQPDYIALAMVLALFVVVAVMALRKRFAKPAAGSPVPVPAADTAPVEIPAAPAAAPAVTGTGEAVTAPMPGNILKVNVTAGQAVKEGDVLCILEAMKMENEIMAPKSGTVTQVLTAKGSTVDTGALLIVIG